MFTGFAFAPPGDAQAPLDEPARRAESHGPSSTLTWHAIGLPLDVSAAGVAFAEDVATYIETFCDPACPNGVQQVAKWDVDNQTLVIHEVGTGNPPGFPVATGDALLIGTADPTLFNATSFAWIGAVPPMCPDPGCLRYSLRGDSWNFLVLPLEKQGLATADQLAGDIDPSITQVATWDLASQTLVIRSAGGFYPPDFDVRPGHPYLVFLAGSSSVTWP